MMSSLLWRVETKTFEALTRVVRIFWGRRNERME